MIDLTTTIWHGLVICIPFTIFAVGSFWTWPRLWLHSLPADIQKMAGGKTEAEQRQTKWLLIPYLLILPGLSFMSAVQMGGQLENGLTFWGALVHIYTIWLIVHLWDFVVIDCTHALLINVEHPPIAGTAGAKGYRDIKFHFRSLIKASLMSSLLVVPLAILAAIFR